MSVKFGTSGLRGLVSGDDRPGLRRACPRPSSPTSRRRGRPSAVLVGRDLRPSSPRIAAACRRAVRDGRRRRRSTAACCRPRRWRSRRRGAALPAMMVTGSHIPFDRNGLKFYRAGGEITKADEAGIRRGARRAAGRGGRPAARADRRRRRALRRALGRLLRPGVPRRPPRRPLASTAPPGATYLRGPRGARRRGRRRSAAPTASCRSTPRRSPPDRCRAHRRLGGGAPPRGARLHRRRRRPAARRRRDRAGAARRRARQRWRRRLLGADAVAARSTPAPRSRPRAGSRGSLRTRIGSPLRHRGDRRG